MGHILTIATSKGGGGKTSLTTLLAASLAPRMRVAVVDADRNATFAHWHRHAYEGGAELTCREEIRYVEVVDLLQSLAEQADVVIADTAGFENQTAAMAMATSDHVLIPCMADRGSVREAIKTAKQALALGKAARREKIPFTLVPMAWNPRGLAERAALEDLSEAEAALGVGLPVARQHISQSAEIRKMSFSGRVPLSGGVGLEVGRLVEDLAERGALPPTAATALSAAHAQA